MYNASLALYYVLVIAKGWSTKDISKVEPFFHAHALIWGAGTAIASLALTLFNQVGWDCWITAAPLGCQESWNSPDGTTTCTRGDNGSLYQWAFYYAPLWVVLVFVTVMMHWIYSSVRAQDIKVSKYSIGSILQVSGKAEVANHKRIASQALAYLGAFYLAWFFPTLFQLVIVISGKYPFPLLFLTALFVPIQGVFNLIVFIAPKFERYRRRHLEDNELYLLSWFRVLGHELKVIKNEDVPSSSRGTLNSV